MGGRLSRRTRPWVTRGALLLALAAWLVWTPGGRYHRTAYSNTAKALQTWSDARATPYLDRWNGYYDPTYPFLQYLRDVTPPEAVILLPPPGYIRDKTEGNFIPLLAGSCSSYSFLYPRVPVHEDHDSPLRNDVTLLFAWEFWKHEEFFPGQPQTEETRHVILELVSPAP